VRGNRKWAAAAAGALAETAVGAGPGGAGTGCGPPGRGERRSCGRRRDRCGTTTGEASGGAAHLGPWRGRGRAGLLGPGSSTLHPGGRAGRRGSWGSRALCFKSLGSRPPAAWSRAGRSPGRPTTVLPLPGAAGQAAVGAWTRREVLTRKWFPNRRRGSGRSRPPRAPDDQASQPLAV
jgi:hypothetical protein